MTNEPVGHKRVWDKERERIRKAEQRASKKSGTPAQSSPDTIEEELVVEDVVDSILEGLDAPLKKELADLEERVRWARQNALPPSRNPQGELVETREDVQDRAEAYARWRYQSWKDGKTVSPY